MATYYISTTGNNSTGDGSFGNPWATLSYAISNVTTFGDVIHVNAGTYPEINTQMHLENGVSIEGDGDDITTIPLTYNGGTPCIKLETGNGWENKGTVGHQHISGIKFIGSTIPGTPVGRCAIGVNFRNYVEIYDCWFEDFVYQAAWFSGEPTYNDWSINNPYEGRSGVDSEFLPYNDSFCTGNKFYNNIVHNSCGLISSNMYSGELEVATQDGMLIYGNYMTATGRTSNQNGVPIKLIGDCGFNRNCKIHDNEVIAGHMSTNYWQFAMEIWWDLGGTEIYNNYCEGALDLCDSWDQYGVGYGIKCYNNEIGYSSNTTSLDRGILFEGSHLKTHVYNNHIHHVARGMTANTTNSSLSTIWNEVYVYNNIVHDLSGASWQTWGFLFDYNVTEQGGLWQDIYIQHNIFHAASTAPDPTAFGIMLPTADDFDDVYIENNILINWERGAIYGDKARDQATNIFIRNNLIYDSYNSNDPYFTGTFPTAGITYSGTVKADPLFVSSSDFHLQSSSPAIGAGISTSITTDYDGVMYANPPSIGAYEYTEDGIIEISVHSNFSII